MVSTTSSSLSAPTARKDSSTSTITVTRQPAPTAVLGTADQVPPQMDASNAAATSEEAVDQVVVPPIPTAVGSAARDASIASRDSLRRRVMQRQQSLTVQEQSFLNDLVVSGNEIEVQLALERLEDEELFFAHSFEALGKAEQRDELFSAPPDPKARPTLNRGSSSQGSQKRLMVLEQRKSSTSSQKQLWKAHQSGLALTQFGSQISLLQRSSSLASSSTYGDRRMPPLDIFRRMSALISSSSASTQHSQTQRGSTGSLSSHNRLSGSSPIPRPSGPNVFKRSQSLAFSPPPIPPRTSLAGSRRLSSSSRKSVTFHERTNGAPKPRPRSSYIKSLRRASSDTAAFQAGATAANAAPLRGVFARQDSVSSIPSIRRGVPIRQDSVSSIPSIRRGVPIRQDSISSIPSLHYANPIRQDSISSIPSLHHANPIRQDSISSFPSLHPAHPIRQDSISSFPSLHHAHPIRQDSLSGIESIPGLQHAHALRSESIRSIPSLHRGIPLRDDSAASLSSILPDGSLLGMSLEDSTEQDQRARLLQRYAATDEVANAWLQQLPGPTSKNPSTPVSPSKGRVAIDPDLSPLTPDPSARSAGQKPVLMRLASKNAYEGAGIEVTEAPPSTPLMLRDSTNRNNNAPVPQSIPPPSFPSIINMDASVLRPSNSFDTMQSYRHPEIFRGLHRSLSDEDMGHLFVGSSPVNFLLLPQESAREVSVYDMADDLICEDDDDDDWDLQSELEGRFDSWNVLKDEYVNGYGGGGTLDFQILGTHADDEAAQPHVLSPPLMESLQAFLPFGQSGQNFWLRYSMVRDGAHLSTLLMLARGVENAVLAIETVDGEVFGAFTGQAWRKNWNYFGTTDSFLWKMRRSRLDHTTGILEQAQLESEIDVFPCTGENRFIQLCTHDRLALGGGTPSATAEKKLEDTGDHPGLLLEDHHWGFGLAIANDLMSGTSSPCVTFGSPSLSNQHSDGSVFEIVNLELWTLTPCMAIADAEKLQLGKLFLQRD